MPTAEELQAGYRLAASEGNAARYVELYEAWFRQMCLEGRPPDALRRDAGTLTERFWAHVLTGLDGHLVWDGSLDSNHKPLFVVKNAKESISVRAQRYAWQLKHGPVDRRIDVWATCGYTNCMNVEHLAAAYLPRGHKAEIPTATLLARVRALAQRLGHAPTRDEYDAVRLPGEHTSSGVSQRYGGRWANVLRAAEVDGRPKASQRRYSDEEALQGVRELTRQMGRVPTSNEYDRSGKRPMRYVLSQRFGTWAEAVRRALG